jgi:hypothetical protein
MKILMMLFLFLPALLAQELKVLNVKGEVKFRVGTSETWSKLTESSKLEKEDFVSTGEKSSVQIKVSNQVFNLTERSAVSLSSIKKMSTDELLLALAMEDMINAPKNNSKNNSSNTAVYGNKEGQEDNLKVKADDFGVMRLNGAVELAKNGFKESAVVYARETYRKYPDSKQIASYRIFFADILYDKGLYEEALGEYLVISKLDLNDSEKLKIEKQIKSINQLLLNN